MHMILDFYRKNCVDRFFRYICCTPTGVGSAQPGRETYLSSLYAVSRAVCGDGDLSMQF